MENNVYSGTYRDITERAAGLYGRGLWKPSMYNGCVSNLSITGISFPIDGTHYYSVSNSIINIRPYLDFPGTNIHFKAGNFIDKVPGFFAISFMIFEAKIGPCPENYQETNSQEVFPKGVLKPKEGNK